MIPNTTGNGVLPPIYPGAQGVSPARAPYQTSLSEFIRHYATSVERINIMKGFCEYRKCLHALGIRNGFQWINGSFAENIEMLENRPPNDIDVVTFFELPDGATQQSLVEANKTLFCDHDAIKRNYKVDGYWVVIDHINVELLIKKSVYWYSLWSHRRTLEWKGFLEIPLIDAELNDETIDVVLDSLSAGGTI